MAIVLIVMGLCDRWLRQIPHLYPWVVGATGLVSVLFALDKLHVPMGPVRELLQCLPFYSYGMGWVPVALLTGAAVTLVTMVSRRFLSADHSAA